MPALTLRKAKWETHRAMAWCIASCIASSHLHALPLTENAAANVPKHRAASPAGVRIAKEEK
jgi:hypothetical protein